jgi:two-component system, OmpR family, sensor histidine kinase VanS
MARARGLSVRWKLTLSYAGFVMLAGALLLLATWLYLTRYPHVGLILMPEYQRHVVRQFAPFAAIVLGALLVFGLGGGWLLAGRMLSPLDRITDAARIVGDGSLSHRIRLAGRQDELRELADAFDAMLARLEAQVEEQRRFAANASHELRTPLAITQTLLDVARGDPARDPGELVDRLTVVNGRAIDLTEALLLLSRADQRAFVAEPVDLSLVAEEAVEALLPLAEGRGIGVEATGDAAVAAGSPALLLQLATNLLHNAIVHGKGHVRIATALRGGRAELEVENAGPELSAALVATLAEPFRRGGGRVRSEHAGVGLGLAIVRSIAEAHDGTLALAPRAGGGLRATVALPAAVDRVGCDR